MALKYNVVAKVGEQPDGNGGKKPKYAQVGVVLDGRNAGEFVMKLDVVPLNSDGWFYFKQPQPRGGGGGGNYNRGGGQRAAAAAPAATGGGGSGFDEMDDDIPF